jgi:hypothetical protein
MKKPFGTNVRSALKLILRNTSFEAFMEVIAQSVAF